ncbi:hypothetical protein QAD02_020777 [Eretmocerus hayati]|uniref:Uncharacterized protein n=1 Tax=Eretmocerus hayati TaxID=131215 RepID=A0ACC2PN04_9HYME|nr:hypothetical protein QAD02_020777 [Eretmocerus hayati]
MNVLKGSLNLARAHIMEEVNAIDEFLGGNVARMDVDAGNDGVPLPVEPALRGNQPRNLPPVEFAAAPPVVREPLAQDEAVHQAERERRIRQAAAHQPGARGPPAKKEKGKKNKFYSIEVII